MRSSSASGRTSSACSRRCDVEDDDRPGRGQQDNRVLIQALLGARYEIVAYASGQEALEGIPARPPELVLLDVSLPEMDGLEVLRRLRESPDLGAIPIVAVTAHAMVGDRERLLAAGFDKYVSKPIVSDRDLVALIEGLLQREAR